MICKQSTFRFTLKIYLVEVILSENNIVFPYMPLLIRNLVEEIYIPQLESCKSENHHAADQISSGYAINETANQSIVAALFNRMQPYEKALSRMWSTSITSSSGTSGSKKRKKSEKGNIQGDGLDVDNELINEIVG